MRSFYILDKAEGIFGFSRPNPPRLIAMLVLAPGRSGSAHFMFNFSVSMHSQWIVSCLEGPVISVHSMQVACFLFFDSHTRKGRGTTPKIVKPLTFAPLHYSLNSCLHRHPLSH